MPRSRRISLIGALALLGIVCLLGRDSDEIALAALAMPSVLYAGVIVSAAERLFVSRILGAVAITSIAPAATGALSTQSAFFWLWLALAFLPAFLGSRRRKGLVPRPAHRLY